ncbi:MAG: glutathione S-transferase N-terminal domain-containing protein [Pseudomonadota bacterium]
MENNLFNFYELCGVDQNCRFSPYCWSVRMALKHKNLEFKSIPLSFLNKEPIAPSGGTTLPVIQYQKTWVRDSLQIACFLDQQFSQAPLLMPNGAAHLSFFFEWAYQSLFPIISRLIILSVYKRISATDQQYFRQSREQRFGMKLEEVGKPVEKYLTMLNTTLKPLNACLEKQDFIAGDQPDYRDFIAYGLFQWARSVHQNPLIEKTSSIYQWRSKLDQYYLHKDCDFTFYEQY